MALFLCLLAAVWYGYFGRVVYSSQVDPTGEYRAVVSHRPIYHLPLPIYRWGVHGDTPAFVTIRERGHRSCGEIPIPSTQDAEVLWADCSAAVPGIGEWDFLERTCFYWVDGGNGKVYTKK